MTVAELIEHLQQYDPGMQVVYEKYSEQCLLEAGELTVKELCYCRDDGWVQNKRPDKPSIPYLVFPGN